MRFDMSDRPATEQDFGPRVGDVYRMKGGRKGGGYWVIVGQVNRMSVCIGLNFEGEIVSTTQYGTDVFERRDRVGFVRNISELVLDIQWEV
jgi:hypothetical protein